MNQRHVRGSVLPAFAGILALMALGAASVQARSDSDSNVIGSTLRDGGAGCSGCHTAGSVTTIIGGPFQGAMNRGEMQVLSVNMFATVANGTRVGLVLATGTNGALSVNPGQPMKTAGTNELRHATSVGALPTTSSNSASYSFRFTMPADAVVGSTHTIYGVSAVGFSGSSHATNRTIVVRPIAPTALAASNISPASVTLSWSGSGPHYRVLYKTGAAPPSGENDGTPVDIFSNTTTTTITGLSSSTQYSFAVFSKLDTDSIYSSTGATTSATTTTQVIAPRYVNASSGTNTGDCTSSSTPCKTVTYAMAQATAGTPGDSVNVAPGTYNVALGEVFPITVKSGVQLKSTGNASNTTIDATGATPMQGILDIAGNAHSGTLIEGFTFMGGMNLGSFGGNANGGAITLNTGGSPTIRNNVFLANEARGYAGSDPTFVSGGQAYGGAIYAQGSPNIVNNIFRSNIARGGTGRSVFGVAGSGAGGGSGQGGAIYIVGAGTIVNNTFYGNQAIGGNGGASTVSGTGGGGGNGYAGAVSATNASVNNNVFVDNSAIRGNGGSGAPAGLGGDNGYGALQYSSAPSATNNLLFGNTAPLAPSSGDNVGSNPVFSDPLFHAAPDNLRITNASPAKGAGTATGAPAADFAGTPRANPPSIGAFEAADPTIVYNLVLEGWQQVAPYVVTAATGTGTATYNTVTRALTLNLPYSGLGSAESAAHIHGPGARGVNAGVLYGLAPASPKADTVTLTVAQETQLFAGELYVNIHSANYPNGEIRAQIDNVGATVTRVLTVNKGGTGSGTVTGTAEPGTVINCGGDCTETVPNGKAVTLAAVAAAGSTFAGWSGGGCTGTGNCVATLNAAATVTATFTANPAAPAVGLSVTSIGFGSQSMGTSSPASTITLTNAGNAVLTVSQVSSDNAQFIQTNNCASVPAGASCAIQVVFSPAIVPGSLNATVDVAGMIWITSDASGSPHSVTLSGTADKSLVTHYYRAILNRAPDAAGKAFWESEAARLAGLGVNISEVWFVMAGYFFNSSEYVGANKTEMQFVTDLYNTFFNRGPDAAGLGYWTGQIASGLPREVVLFSFMFSAEFRGFSEAIFGNTAARPEVDMVVDFFRGLLNRLPDTTSFNYWLGQLRTAQCAGAGPVYTAVDQISAAFMFNPEYTNRGRSNTQFVTDMYYSFLRRGGDVGGVQYWINELDSGARYPNDVRYFGFLNGPEFGARVQAVIGAGCVQ
ncbi:MAG TPA: DUF4214 domain-containing protein [Usitatibacter sp.]|nr:DUF4214 domain-containing protein [Usitatibacter sp.]